MEFGEVINRHYVVFSEVVDPVSLASKLRSLTSYDRDVIQCKTTHSGRAHGIQLLCRSIISKVEWPELCAALRKENLIRLLKTLEDEYYRQHPTARPCPQNENLKPEVNQFEDSSDSNTDGNIDDGANSNLSSNANTSSDTKASYVMNVSYVQSGDHNIMITCSHFQNGGSELHKEHEVPYEVCVESDGSNGQEKNENEENMVKNNSPDTVQHSMVPNEPAVPQNVSPQLSSSGSDSQDGGSPKVCCHDETDEHTAVKRIYQEGNGDDIVRSAPGDNISLHENTNTMSPSIGCVETGGRISPEILGIVMRTENKGFKGGEEEENGEEEHEEETKLKAV